MVLRDTLWVCLHIKMLTVLKGLYARTPRSSHRYRTMNDPRPCILKKTLYKEGIILE